MQHARSVPRALRATVAPCLALLLVGVSLAACTPSDRFSAGHLLTPEELDSIGESFYAATEPAPEAEPIFETVGDFLVDDYPEGTVFWADQPPVYHTDLYCRHLMRQSTVFHGSLNAAAAAGKSRLCGTCAEGEET